MITEKNFVQIQFDAEKEYMAKTEKRYATAGEKQAASNSYIQGRVDAVADMENLVVQYNVMLKQRNKLAKELAILKAEMSDEDLGL